MRQLQSVYVSKVHRDGRVQVVWSKLDIDADQPQHGPFCTVPRDRLEGTFNVGARAQALVETDGSVVVKLLNPPGAP